MFLSAKNCRNTYTGNASAMSIEYVVVFIIFIIYF